jgi:hypothetical protein
MLLRPATATPLANKSAAQVNVGAARKGQLETARMLDECEKPQNGNQKHENK